MVLLLSPTFLALLVFTVLFALAAVVTGVLFIRALLKYLRLRHPSGVASAPENIETGIKRQESEPGSE